MTTTLSVQNIPEARETRVLLRARGILDQYRQGGEQTDVQAIARSLCQRRIQAVGTRQYVYDILGERASWPARLFRLWYGDAMIVPNSRGKLIEFLMERDVLPDKVEIESKDDGKQYTFYITV